MAIRGFSVAILVLVAGVCCAQGPAGVAPPPPGVIDTKIVNRPPPNAFGCELPNRCVPFYRCTEENVINSDGEGLLDLRTKLTKPKKPAKRSTDVEDPAVPVR
jgi:hypothetical protein